MTATLLFEIGVEELPASFIHSALDSLPGLASGALSRARLEHGDIRALGTPRRLTLVVASVASRQRDLSELVTGPPERAAFDEDGAPKKAALGFAKKLGIDVSALQIVETDRGNYVAGRREERGRTATDVLPELLVEIATKIPFPKSMRWGEGEIAFGRPVQWLVALLGDTPLTLTFGGIEAGRESRGHRFLSPSVFELRHADAYVERLREARVLVDPAERESSMRGALDTAAADAGGTWVEDLFLVDENAGMVEAPFVIAGSFDAPFLELPDEVTVEVMRGHQRYFAMRDAEGRLMPRYLAVLNTDRAPDIITRGNDRVLRARLADARFFVEDDLATGLEAMVAPLNSVVFQRKLGTVGERVARLEEVVSALGDSGPGREAARLCKADLVSQIVGEFPELQGVMGAWYAKKAGVEETVSNAIRDHYSPRGASDGVPQCETAARLAVADRADALVGCFGIGLVPSGSADPFALRRAALGIIRIALEGPIDVDLRAALGAAHEAYVAQEKPVADRAEVLEALDAFFRARLKAHQANRYPTEVLDACMAAWDGRSVRDLAARFAALEAFRGTDAFESLAVAFKRAHNIAKEAPDAEPFSEDQLVEPAERALAEAWSSLRARVTAATASGDYARALGLIGDELRGPIDRFFEEVFVMVDDLAVRHNRLRLLAEIDGSLTGIAAFHLLGTL